MPAHLERKSNFDSQWKFFNGDVEGANSVSFDAAGWKTLDLPHDWSMEGPVSQDAPAAGNGAYLPTGIGWYRKQFTLPAAARGKRVLLQFDGVYQRSEVWINGTSLGMRPFGFITFTYDLTPHLNPASKPNQLVVRGRQLSAAELSLVLRLRHIPAHLAHHHESDSYRSMGDLR